mmetsp:Transcript_37847/g.113139  ORF Transcript_37847/g.113139 Transcript_37847/m.113139 type:complete len:330 (-) Transcript_37847:174-1163(-)
MADEEDCCNATRKRNHPKSSVENLCGLFSSTVSTLAADAECLRQISSIRLAIGINDDDRGFDENVDPNAGCSTSASFSSDILSRLCRIEDSVSTLEENIAMLKDTLADEKRGLRQLEELKEAARAQEDFIEKLSDGSRGLRFPADNKPESSMHNKDCNGLTSGQRGIPRDGLRGNRKVRQAASNRAQANPADSIRIDLVTESELNSVSKSIRGRITLAVINDAVVDVEKACQNKYTILAREGGRQGGRQMLMTKQYRQLLAAHQSTEVDEHKSHYWIEEDTLRNSCAFFRTGESTARAILSILRTLKRLKQVCGKHSQVTYIVLPSALR